MRYRRLLKDAVTGKTVSLNVWVNPDKPVYGLSVYVEGREPDGGEFDVGLSDSARRDLSALLSNVLTGNCGQGVASFNSLANGKCEIRVARKSQDVTLVDFILDELEEPDDTFISHSHVSPSLNDDDFSWPEIK